MVICAKFILMNVNRLLARIIPEGATALDVGCGEGHPYISSGLTLKLRVTGLDSHQPSLNQAQKGGYDRTMLGELPAALSIIPTDHFDYVTALDVIEHLPKDEGLSLARDMIRVARCKAIIATPLGFLEQASSVDNPRQEHLSGWRPDELRAVGYDEFKGLNGWRPLRGPYGLPTLKPPRLGSGLARLSAPLVTKFPNHAFQFAAISSPATGRI